MKLEDNYMKQVRKLHWLEHFHIIQLDNGAEHNLSDAQKSRLEWIPTAEQRVHKAPELQMKRGMRSSRTGNYQFVRLLFEGTVPPPATQKFPWILNPQNQPWGRRQCGKLREPTATTVPIPLPHGHINIGGSCI